MHKLFGFINHFLQKLAHLLCKWACFYGHCRFNWATNNIKKAQNLCLHNIVEDITQTPTGKQYAIHSHVTIEEFQKIVPITSYQDWEKSIEEQRSSNKNILSNSPCNRYQPTSGSTSAIKWIPYTSRFLSQLNNALSPWIWDLYSKHPQLSNGRHYWSLSWIPSNLRNDVVDNVNNDLKLLPIWKRLFTSLIMTVPETVSQTKTSEESWFKTLCYLTSDNSLSMISVWSPTFALGIFESLTQYREDIITTLKQGVWPQHLNDTQGLPCPKNQHTALLFENWSGEINKEFIQKLWPNLTLISAWDTSTSALWAKQLQQLVPYSHFQGKGLWATEGVITFPLGNKYPLAINSHFYEFIDTQNGAIYLPWQLKRDQKVRPVITTGSGLLRYAMKDQLKVVDFINQCPCFEFLGRIDGADMVGEKLSAELATHLLHEFEVEFSQHNIKPLSLLAMPSTQKNNKPYYIMLCQGEPIEQSYQHDMQQYIETTLQKHFHYQLARELGQLLHSLVVISPTAWDIYHDYGKRRGIVKGNLKIEPLLIWDDHIFSDEIDIIEEAQNCS